MNEKQIDQEPDRRLHDGDRDRLADADVVSDDEHDDPADQRDDARDDEEPEEGERRHDQRDDHGDEQRARQRVARVLGRDEPHRPHDHHCVDEPADEQDAERVHSYTQWWSWGRWGSRSEEHTSELQSHSDLVCRLLLEEKKKKKKKSDYTQD